MGMGSDFSIFSVLLEFVTTFPDTPDMMLFSNDVWIFC